jgi:hypothetical protein
MLAPRQRTKTGSTLGKFETAFSPPDIICRASPQDRDEQVRNRQRSQNHPLDREKIQRNVDLHFAVESQTHSISVAPQE